MGSGGTEVPVCSKPDIQTLRQQIISEIIKRGAMYDDFAKNDAVEFARKPDDETLKQRASMSVMRADSMGQMASDLTETINRMFSAFISQSR